MPESFTSIATLEPTGLAVSTMRPPESRELHGVDEEVPHHLLQPAGIADHRAHLGSNVDAQLQALRVRGGLHDVHGRPEDAG